MNTYENLAAALAKNAYKKGDFKGDAPADPIRRGRNHIRVADRGHAMVVVMYSTDILTAYPDGRVEVSLKGWHNSMTTREAFNDAVGTYRGHLLPHMYAHSMTVFGVSQTVLTVNEKSYHLDGAPLEFDEQGVLLSIPSVFSAKRVDAAESKAFRAKLKASGFTDMYPLLYASAPPNVDAYTVIPPPHRMIEMLSDADSAHRWSELVASFKYEQMWNWACKQYYIRELRDAKACWARMMYPLTDSMRHVVDSNTTVLIRGTKPKFFPFETTPLV